MPKQAVIFVAPPGAGKGTQADLVAKKFGFVHLESSQIIQEKFDTADPNDLVIKRERELFSSGKLMTPEVVASWALDKIRALAAQDISIVFSGSFRTLYEVSVELPVIEELYGKENIKLFNITLSEDETVRRNSNRRICEKNRHPIPNLPPYIDMKVCPEDGSPLIKRGDLDTPDVARKRYQQYLERTQPVFDYFKDRGYEFITVNGEQSIENVAKDIMSHLQ